jgi:septal ring factor EnvC (AmiA/AmiB activator)
MSKHEHAKTRKHETEPICSFPCVRAFVLSCLWGGALVLAAGAQTDRARTEAMARRAGERLHALQREADRLASEERSVLTDLRKLEVERQLRGEELKQLDAESARVRTDLAETTSRLDALRSAEAAEKPELRARIVEIYKLGQARYARLLFSASDLRRLGEASRTVAALAKLDRDRVAAFQKTREEVAAARSTLEERQRTLDALRADVERAHAAALQAERARNDLVRDIDRRRDLNAQLSGELQAAQQKLQLALRDIGAAAGAADAVLPLKPFRGDLDWPVAGTVRRRFGRTTGPGGTPSNGIEIASAEGADARAVHDGVVAFAGPFPEFGNLVIVDHGAQTFSLYGDLLDLAVKKGTRVGHGQPVGSVGATSAGTAGLYFELRVDGRPVDPLQWLKKR